MHLEAELSAPRAGRRFVAARTSTSPRADDIELLVSELVSNVVEHTRGPAEVTVIVADAMVRVEVADTSTELPAMRTPDDEGGRGLLLVEALADRWGIDQREVGKAVWFEIDDEPSLFRRRQR